MGIKEDCISVGTITILTKDLVLFQGIVRPEDCDRKCHGDEPEININNEIKRDHEFITLRLQCVPVVIGITGAAFHFVGVPFYRVDDIIRINVDEIISIGTNSTGCLATSG